jgi:hypothetical protein
MMMGRGWSAAVGLLGGVLVAGCQVFPAPVPPVPLTKAEVAAVAKCQKSVKKAQIAFVKAKLGALESCVDGVLNVQLPFENGLTTSADFDAGIAKMRPKCTKRYAKVTAASTKLVDAILKACVPVETFVLGPYDALRFQSATDVIGDPALSIVDFAGSLCTWTAEFVDAQLWHAAPRLIELLGYLGPEFIVMVDVSSGLPNTPLDPRCLPLTGVVPSPIPTSTPDPP